MQTNAFSDENPLKQNKNKNKNKNTYEKHKNAPIPRKEDNSEYREVKTLRTNMQDTIAKKKTEDSFELQKAANIAASKTQHVKEAIRDEYRAKQIIKEERRKAYASRKFNQNNAVSDLLSLKTDITITRRIYDYAKYHSCIHGLACNVIRRGKTQYEFGCSHNPGSRTPASPYKCKACGVTTNAVYTSKCGCTYRVCFRCKRSMHFYEFSDESQWYDKHSYHYSIGSILHFKALGEDTYLQPWTPPSDKEEVVVPADKPKSYAAAVSEPTKKDVIEKPIQPTMTVIGKNRRKKDARRAQALLIDSTTVLTTPQAGILSSITQPLNATIDSVRSTIKSMGDSITLSLRTTLENLLAQKITGSIIEQLIKVLKTVKYVVSVVWDYVTVLNPLHIYNLWQGRDRKMSYLVNLALMMRELASAEELSRIRMLLRISTHGFEFFKTDIIENDYGCLTTIIRDLLLRKTKMTKNDLLTHLLTCGIHYQSMSTEERKRQVEKVLTDSSTNISSSLYSKINGIFNKFKKNKKDSETPTTAEGSFDFTHLFQLLPSYLRTGGRALSAICKDFLPILMTIKATTEISKHANKLTQYIIDWIQGEIRDPREWIRNEISRENSPIHECVSTYVAYNTCVYGKANVDANQLRNQFFIKLGECDKFVQEKKKFGFEWTSFKKHLTEGFNVPPKPVARDFEPTSLILSGPPGTGKSTIWPAIVAGEIATSDSKTKVKDTLAATYTWTTVTDFQSGLADAKVVLFDDLGQDRESAEAIAFIQLMTSAAYPINSPNISGPEIKGCLAAPSVLVACTNVTPELLGDKLAESEAIIRRYDLEIAVTKRFDQDKPKDPIGYIKRCAKYQNLINKEVSLRDIQVIFATIHRTKRSDFLSTRKMISTIADVDMDNFLIEDMNEAISFDSKSIWQESKDFMKDYKEHVQTVQESGIIGDVCNFVGFASAFLCSGVIMAAPLTVAHHTVLHAAHIFGHLGQSYRSKLSPFQTAKKILGEFTVCALKCLATIGLAFTLFKVMNTSLESGTTRTAKQHAPVVSVPQSGDATDPLDKLFKRATGNIWDENNLSVNGIFVGGHFFLTVRHFFLDPIDGTLRPDGTVFNIRKSTWTSGKKTFVFDSSRLRPLSGNIGIVKEKLPSFRQDVILYELDNREFQAEKNIVNHFWKGDYCPTNFEVEKIDFIPHGTEGWEPNFMSCVGTVTHDQMLTTRSENGVIISHVVAEANYMNRDSSCGSIVRRNIQEQPILGIHVARGRSHLSYFHYVTSDSLKNAMSRNTTPLDLSVESINTEIECGISFIPSNSTLVYQGRTKNRLFQNSKTQLRPSTVYEAFGQHTMEPSVLHGNDPRLPLNFKSDAFYRQLFEGYRPIPGSFTEEDLEAPIASMRASISKILSKSFVKIKKLTLDEAINGLKYIPGNTSVDMSTSCGFPYVTRGIKKEDLFIVTEVNGERHIIPTDTIKRDYYIALDQLEHGVIPFLPFGLTLKDERIKISKIEVPKTRIFACANVINFLICRTYFYPFLMAMYHASIHDSWCFPSLDRLSLDWHEYSSHMLEAGSEGFDFDFKYYDRTMSHRLIFESAKLMLAGHTLSKIEENTLLEMISSPYTVWGDNVFRSSGINMSGVLITYMINCVANELMHRAAWSNLAARHAPKLLELRYYLKYTRGMRGGDDTVTTVDPRVLPWYNGVTVAEFLNSRGMYVTSPDKNADIAPYKPFKELSFLKNTTGTMRGYYIPLPEIASLMEACYWIRINKYVTDELAATQDNVICALRGIYFHGEATYEALRKVLLTHDPRLQLPSHRELSSIWWKYHNFPGSHSDYSTRDQDDIFDVNVTHHYIGAKAFTKEVQHNMQTIDTISQVGALDKETSDQNTHYNDTIETTTTRLDDVHLPSETIPMPSQVTEVVMNEDPSVTVAERIGATVQDASQKTIKDTTLGSLRPNPSNDRSINYMNDDDWTLSKLVAKWTQIAIVQWPLTSTQGTTLFSTPVPSGLLITPAQLAPIDATSFYKFSHARIKLVVKSSPFYAGSIVAGFQPYATSNSLVTVNQMLMNGASLIKLSQDESVEFNVPFRYHKGYIAAPEDIGRFIIKVISPLKTGSNNANTINITVYASLEGTSFKVPEVIPATSYISHKFHSNSRVVTFPQSGPDYNIKGNSSKVEIININSPVNEMKKTMLCAGPGMVGKVKPGHFQDAPDDLLTLAKRWRKVAFFFATVGSKETVTGVWQERDIVKSAAGYLAEIFALYRGSVILRATLTQTDVSEIDLIGTISYQPVRTTEKNLYGTTRYDGVHYFDQRTVGQVVIPYMARTFTRPFDDPEAFTGRLNIDILNTGQKNIEFTLELDIAIGDDFHVGLTTGLYLPFADPNNIPLDPIEFREDEWTAKPLAVDTFVQAGVIEYIDRALETALPIVEKVSALGSQQDAHMIQYQPYPITTRKVPLSIAADLHNFKETLLTTNHNGMSNPDKEAFGMDKGETSITNMITKTKSLYQTINWAESAAAGTRIAQLSPGPGVVTAGGINIGPAIHEEIPRLFHYWTGSTVYLFDIIATEQHRGQLLFSYVPNGVNPSSIAEATQSYFTTYDLAKGRGTLAIQLPYLSPYPYSLVPARDGEALEGNDYPGQLYIYVQNPLRSTTTVASSVDIIVYKAYGDDFRLAVYGNNTTISGQAPTRVKSKPIPIPSKGFFS